MLGDAGMNSRTADASETFAYLNGLKSSLICTGVPFLIGRVPKYGLGADVSGTATGAAFTAGAADDDAELPCKSIKH